MQKLSIATESTSNPPSSRKSPAPGPQPGRMTPCPLAQVSRGTSPPCWAGPSPLQPIARAPPGAGLARFRALTGRLWGGARRDARSDWALLGRGRAGALRARFWCLPNARITWRGARDCGSGLRCSRPHRVARCPRLHLTVAPRSGVG